MQNNLIYVGFNGKVIALDRSNGNVAWRWNTPKSGGNYVTLLPDGDQLIVSIMGYTYCLDAATGRQLWNNDLPGTGMGVASLASARGATNPLGAAAHVDANSSAHTGTY